MVESGRRVSSVADVSFFTVWQTFKSVGVSDVAELSRKTNRSDRVTACCQDGSAIQ